MDRSTWHLEFSNENNFIFTYLGYPKQKNGIAY